MTTQTNEKLSVYNAHQKVVPATMTGNSRDTDSRALISCAHRLDAACKLMEKDKSKEALKIYGDAIRHNQRLWTIFQVALCDPENHLPQHLKIMLLNLSRYIDKVSFRAMGKFTPDIINSLVNINRILAKGLSKQPPANAEAYAPPVSASEVPTSLTTSA
ncbi:MAG: flagellar biosynthesis regulator FlaF [Alphaproteobacteria bacterium]|nr:flagellar biosynthesis regulator FlaF [Alphaproteobacteria bacterium]